MSRSGAGAPHLAVVTVVSGRHAHLRAQRAALERDGAELHVVVAIADPQIRTIAAERPRLSTTTLDIPATAAGLPVAAARNRGAAAALAAGTEALVFLDVDCIPDAGFTAAWADAITAHPDEALCGPVTYLPPAPAGGWTTTALAAARDPHPARPDPAAGEALPLAPALFWSLNFAVSAELWRRLGGFHEGYVGYGAEDTDFAACAAAQGVGITMVGGVHASHQHHPVSNPPREHLDDIVRNSGIYLRRHGHLPMQGWLAGFAAEGLVDLTAPAPRRTDAPVVATVPARHPYLDAVLPATVRRFATDRVRGWEPDPLLRPDHLAAHAAAIDVVHLHFSYEHVAPAELDRWLAELRRLGIPLAVTVHDLRNPHQLDPSRHEAHLVSLLAAADAVLTLTDSVARECAQRFGRRPDVVPHPPLALDGAEPAVTGAPELLVPLKNLRTNVMEPDLLVAHLVTAAAPAGARVRVLVDPAALARPALAGLRELATTRPDVLLVDARAHLPHRDLADLVARAHACVLPYRFGTHSGWIELCRDLGVHVLAPDCGHYAGQWDQVRTFGNNEHTGLDGRSLRDTVTAVCSAPRPEPAPADEREALGDLIRARHDVLYRALASR